MERPKRKAINFDLDTNIMKDHRLYPNGYELLRVSFKNHGFEHRQGSGYLSTGKLTSDQVYEIVEDIVKEQPWLADCVKKIDVTDIGKQHDLTAIVRQIATQAKQARQAEQAKQAEQSKESKFSSREDQINSLMSVCKRQLSNEIARDQAQEQRQAEQARQAEQVGQVRQAGANSSGAKGKGKAPRGK